MNKFLLSAFFLLLLFTAIARSGNGLDEIIAAIRSGSVTELAPHTDDNLGLSIQGKEGNFTRQEAVSLLRAFFEANPVKGFTVKFKGEKGGSRFCIGTLQTAAGAFRTTVFLKDKGDQQIIKELRFQKE